TVLDTMAVTPDCRAMAALNRLTVSNKSPCDVKLTPIAFGICLRSAMHCWRRAVSTFLELIVFAATGSGRSPGSMKWFTMKNDLSVPPRIGRQSNFEIDLYVNGVSCETS